MESNDNHISFDEETGEFNDIYEDEKPLPDNNFIIMWCNSGLECVIPVDMDHMSEGADFLAALGGVENTYAKEINKTVFMLKLRAQANTQRHYEIYSLKTSDGITKETLEEIFESTPQMIVDIIREKGVKIYSNRAMESPRIF
jgi:hypothetical protein